MMDVAALYTRIEKVIEVNAGTIVLENPSGFPRNETNLYLVDRRGEIIWKAEKPDPYTYFSRVKLNEDGDTFSAYTLGGHACELELRTGKLISLQSFNKNTRLCRCALLVTMTFMVKHKICSFKRTAQNQNSRLGSRPTA